MLYKNYTDLVNKLVWIIPKKAKEIILEIFLTI